MPQDRCGPAAGEMAPTALRRPTLPQIAKLGLSLLLGGLLLYSLHASGVPLIPAADVFVHVKWWTVGAYVLLVAASSYFRGARWRLLLRPVVAVSRWEALSAVLIGSAAVLLLPFRLGETVRPYLVAKSGRVSVVAALATVVAERIIDGLVLSLILGATLLTVPTIVPLPEQVVGIPVPVRAVRGYGWTFFVTFAGAFAVIVVFHAARSFAIRLTQTILGKLWSRGADLVASTLSRFADGLGFFAHRRLAQSFLLETAAYWLLGALGYWLLGWGSGVVHADGSAMTFGEACAIMGMLGIASALPGPPGLLGLFQAGAFAAMTMFYPREVIMGPGAAFVFLLYVTYLGFTVVTATGCVIASAVRPVSKAPLAT